ncbi:terminase small subunit [Xanthomonas phage FMYAK-P1]|uniref:Terminase small subunit n=1 Tax=Xanthomonas phage FMYAK-P1 TaxID=2886031 RepID=A0AAE8YNF8_9CAUD|nr:terminase small subunit [Xanthomonas phage FMYAK-P1]UGL62794.1 terminase small subunit [Xanthomonas phage FMYAK-P1]UGL62866.1 terminase small subunit [Xanthomonas phage MET13-T1]
MSVKNMTEDERLFLSERGPVSELELVEWELEGLNTQERMSAERRRLFLRAFALRGIVLDGCRAAGVSRGAVEHWRETSEWFNTMFEIAREEAADRIEAEAFRRAVDGYDEPVIYQGMTTTVIDKVTGEEKQLVVRKYSDALMQTLLKGARPDKYRENHRVEHAGAAGGVLVIPAAIDKDTWAQEVQRQQAKYAGNNEGGDQPPPAG